MNPLDPAAVRRLGDQRRRRQNTMYGAIAAVVVAAAVIPTALIATKGDGKASPPPILNSGTPTPTPTPTVIVFPGGGVAIKAPQDTDNLVGTSGEFKTFIKGVWQKDHDDGCKTAEIDVTKYSSAGFGVGGVGGCGGYQAIWVLKDGTWIEALGTQDEWVCSDLARYDVPDGFAGDCYVPDPAPAVVTFPGNGQGVNQESDAAKLQGTTDDFKEFIIGQVAQLQADATTHGADCPDPSMAGVTVKKFAQAGYAVGSVFLCPSGYEAIWKKVDGTWKEVLAGQDQWSCPDLDRFGIPHSFIGGDCYQPKLFGPDTVAGVALGMNTDEVTAAGASVEAVAGSTGTCRAVKIPTLGKADDSDGLYDPTYGVFSITATGPGEWRTPEGIGYGQSRADVEDAYPNGHENPETGTWVAPLSGGRHYEFNTSGGTVTSMSLATDKTYCMFQ